MGLLFFAFIRNIVEICLVVQEIDKYAIIEILLFLPLCHIGIVLSTLFGVFRNPWHYSGNMWMCII